jgi:hypothetical protein
LNFCLRSRAVGLGSIKDRTIEIAYLESVDHGLHLSRHYPNNESDVYYRHGGAADDGEARPARQPHSGRRAPAHRGGARQEGAEGYALGEDRVIGIASAPGIRKSTQ